MESMNVLMESVEPESVAYKRGNVYIILTGFHAALYRQMALFYGEAEATERFWWLWHKERKAL